MAVLRVGHQGVRRTWPRSPASPEAGWTAPVTGATALFSPALNILLSDQPGLQDTLWYQGPAATPGGGRGGTYTLEVTCCRWTLMSPHRTPLPQVPPRLQHHGGTRNPGLGERRPAFWASSPSVFSPPELRAACLPKWGRCLEEPQSRLDPMGPRVGSGSHWLMGSLCFICSDGWAGPAPLQSAKMF